MYLEETGQVGVDGINLAQQGMMAVSCVCYMDLPSPYNTGNFLTDWVITSVWRSIVRQMM